MPEPTNLSVALPADLAEAMAGPVMILVSVCNDRFRATIGRGAGAVCDTSGDGGSFVDVFVSAAQWPDTVANANLGQRIAVTFGDVSDYRCWQVKGVIEDARPATAIEVARSNLYIERALALLMGWDVSRTQLSDTFCTTDLWRLRLSPREVFNQTPGAGAGKLIAAASA